LDGAQVVDVAAVSLGGRLRGRHRLGWRRRLGCRRQLLCDRGGPSVKLPLQLVHQLQHRLLLLFEFPKLLADRAILSPHFHDFFFQAAWSRLRRLCACGIRKPHQ
jgi:hypothetical protein